MFEQVSLLVGVEVRVVLGVLSGLLSLLCFVPYITDTLARRTQPDRACWLIWSVLSAIALFSQIYEGATVSLAFAAVQVGGTIVVFLLSIWLGAGSYLSPKNQLFLALAALGLVAWYVTDTSAYALVITISISLLGGLLTLQKSYRTPHSETMSKWGMGLAASLCAVGSIGAFDPVLLAYPIYLVVLNGSIVVAILLGRAQAARTPAIFATHGTRIEAPLSVQFGATASVISDVDAEVLARSGPHVFADESLQELRA